VGPLAGAVALVAVWRSCADSVGIGVVLFALAFVGGRARQRFGGGWAVLLARVDSVRRRSTH